MFYRSAEPDSGVASLPLPADASIRTMAEAPSASHGMTRRLGLTNSGAAVEPAASPSAITKGILAVKPIYRQDFERADGADDWFTATERGDIRDPVQRVVGADGNARAVSPGGWWPDPNHIDPGAGWLNLVMLRDATDLPIHEFTDLVFNFMIDLSGLDLPEGAVAYAFFQSQDHQIAWGAGNSVNYVNIAHPITQSGAYSIHFSTNDADWLALGSSASRTDTYAVAASAADALAGSPLNFGIVILRGDGEPTRPLAGIVALDDILIERAGPDRAWVDQDRPDDLQPLDLLVRLQGADTGAMSGLTLTVTGAGSDAALWLNDAPAAGLLVADTVVTIGGVPIATLEGGREGEPLVVRFNDSVVAAEVDAVLAALSFAPGGTTLSALHMRLDDDHAVVSSLDVLVRAGAQLYDGSRDDHVEGGGSVDALRGGGGDDWLQGFGGDDRLDGWADDDRLDGGTGDDILLGGAGDDRLDGGGGSDLLLGGTGDNVLVGGPGDDVLYLDAARDSIVELAGEGDDRIYATVSYALGEGVHVEMLSAYDHTATTALDLSGNTFANSLFGNATANHLDGGGGDDVVYGFEGDDGLNGGDGSDQLSAGAGEDRLDGGLGNDVLLGEAGGDLLDGGTGNDQLIGGIGVDVLAGESGDDVFYVDDAGDTLVEFAGEGEDRMYASVSYVLAEGVALETLSAYDTTAATPVDLTGNAFANLMLGNAADNRLDGGGGDDLIYGIDGDDGLDGGDGNDQLIGGDGADRMTGGTGDDILLGDAGIDTLMGGDGDDQLIGGDGADVMIGASGADSFYVNDAADVTDEREGGGSDRIYTTVSYTLAAAAHVETLGPYDPADATAIDLTGNSLTNVLVGNAGANRLNGQGGDDVLFGGGAGDWLDGGAGSDTLIGAAGGSDVFYFNDATGGGKDTITDFGPADWLVTTRKIRDGNNDGLIHRGRNALFDMFPGESVAIMDEAGQAVTSLHYNGFVVNGAGLYFVYSLSVGDRTQDFASNPFM